MSDCIDSPYQRITLGEIASSDSDSLVDGPFGSNLKTHEYVSQGIRLIQLQNIGEGEWKDDNKKYITEKKYKALARHGAVAGDIAIAKMADPVARACIIPECDKQYVVVADCIKLRINESKFDRGYIVRAINAPYTRREAEKKSIGSTRIRINLSVLKTVGCLVPLLPDQQKIAQILDTLDTTIRQTEAIIAKLQQVKQGLLHDLLTRGIDANGQLRPPVEQAPHLYKESLLGWIPREWEISTIGIEFEIQLGKMLDAEKNAGTMKPYLGNKAIQWDHINIIDMPLVAMSISDMERFRLRCGDLLVCEGGEVGRAAIWESQIDECYYQKALHRLRPKRGFNPRLMLAFLRYWTSHDMISEYVSQTSIAHLTQEKLAIVPLPAPSCDEQTCIIEKLLAHDHKVGSEERTLAKLKSTKSALMDDLLTGRVRVTALLSNETPAFKEPQRKSA